MPRPVRVAACLALAALFAPACSATDGEDVATAATSPRTLTVMLADDWASADAVVDAISDFEAEHDVRVSVRPVKFGQLAEFMIADRTGPRDVDVSQWHAFAAGSLGWARAITPRFSLEFEEGLFIPGAMEDVTWGDEVYGVPLDVNAVVGIVNTTMLDALGHDLDDLATWDGLRGVAESAAAAPQPVRLTHLAASTWSMNAWLRANGGRWFDLDEDGAPQLQFGSPEVLGTFDYLADLTADDQRLARAATAIDTDADAYPLFFDEQLLMIFSGTWDVSRLADDEPDFEWTTVPMPTGPLAEGPGTVLGGSSLYITEQADDPALAWEFVTHLVEPEYALRYAQDSGRLPGRTDVLADPFFDQPTYRTAVEALPSASPMRLIAFPRVFDLATRSIFDVLHHASTPSDEFADLQQTATRLVSAAPEDP